MDFAGAYSTYGDPAAPPIVLLHGIRLGRDIWAPEAPVLARRYHVIVPDLPGHGTLADEAFTDATIAELMEYLLRRVAHEPPLVVGYSLGGYVAMDYASAFPSHVRALLLSGCTLDFQGWKRWPLDVTVNMINSVNPALRQRFMDMNLHIVLPRDWAEIVKNIPFNREVLAQARDLAREHERFSEVLARYRGPVRFVNGEYDVVFRIDERRFVKRCDNADVRIIRGIDHTAPFRKGPEFTKAVLEFADEIFAERRKSA